MANVKISELPSSGPLSSTDLIPTVVSNVTSKSTLANLLTSSPADIYAVVGTAGTITINNNASTITLPSNFQGYRIRVFRNGTLLDYQDQGLGDSYYTYNTSTRVISLSVNASTSEKFVIMAY